MVKTIGDSFKFDGEKPRLDLLMPRAIEAVGVIRTYGAKKYDDYGWKKVEKHRYLAAALRHLLAYMKDPKGVDKESGYPHLWHCLCNISFIVEMDEEEKEKNASASTEKTRGTESEQKVSD